MKIYCCIYAGIFNNLYVLADNADQAIQKCVNAGYNKPLQAIQQNGLSLHYIKVDIK